MLGRTFALAATLALAVPSVLPAQSPTRKASKRPHTIYGRSTYYAEFFDGRETTSGEIYRRDELTAAHRSLPFGSLVRVTNLRNGRSIVVRITDRGPRYRAFQLDVSGRAAELLGFYREMVARVRLDILRFGRDSLTELGKRDTALTRGFGLLQGDGSPAASGEAPSPGLTPPPAAAPGSDATAARTRAPAPARARPRPATLPPTG